MEAHEAMQERARIVRYVLDQASAIRASDGSVDSHETAVLLESLARDIDDRLHQKEHR